jgi:hypothetical protein
VLEDWLVVVAALLTAFWDCRVVVLALVVAAPDEPVAVEACPAKPCAATADTAPVAATAPAISQPLMRRTSARPASRLATVRRVGPELPGVVGRRGIARPTIGRLHKTTVSRR